MKILNQSQVNLIYKTICFSFWLRIFFMLIRAFRDTVHPHSWRQMDTLGVSMRYWLRFTTESDQRGWKVLLPAILQSGDGNGILPVEFPFLNLLFSPLWFFGPYWGKILIYLIFGILMTWLALILSKKRHFLAMSILLLPTISYSADFFEKFLPDTLAMMVVTLGCFALMKSRVKGVLLITLAMLIKPTAIVGLIYLFFFKKFRKNFIWISILLLIPISFTLLYYTKGLEWIRSYSVDTGSLFYVTARNPLESLISLLKYPDFFVDQIMNRFFMAWGTFLFLFMVFFRKKVLNLKIIAWVFCGMGLVFVTICALDGPHLLQHNYYLLSGAPFYCAVFYLILRNTNKWASIIGCLFIVGHSIELCAQNLDLKKYAEYRNKSNESRDLIARNPEFPWKKGHVFRSNNEPYPSIGLFFGERQGSTTSKFGFFYHLEPSDTPAGCKIADSTPHFSLVRCETKN
jgi:hypothetical protein